MKPPRLYVKVGNEPRPIFLLFLPERRRTGQGFYFRPFIRRKEPRPVSGPFVLKRLPTPFVFPVPFVRCLLIVSARFGGYSSPEPQTFRNCLGGSMEKAS